MNDTTRKEPVPVGAGASSKTEILSDTSVDNYTPKTQTCQALRYEPMVITTRAYTSVKAFDGKDKALTYNCAPCPSCGKWLAANTLHKFCEWCGQALKWSDDNDT